MDPSLSISTEPSHPPLPPKFHPFPSAAATVGGLFGSGSGVQNHEVTQTANPAHLPPHPTFTHPPYAEMIRTAIQALNEKDGSSKQAISKYIERVYAGLPLAHSALLTHHLKTLKNSGVLVMVKKSYKLASSVTSSALPFTLEAPRSDLPGDNHDNQQPADAVASGSGDEAPSVKRGRGRPPKLKPQPHISNPNPNPNPVQQYNPEPVVQSNGQASWEQKPESLPVSTPAKRGRGRPRKSGTLAGVAAMASGVKGRGRKPKYASDGPKPNEPAAGQTSAPGPRPRGRPRKNPPTAAFSATQVAPREGGALTASGKRRGRPPKMVGVITKPMKPRRKSTGRPVGRPRKYAVWNNAAATSDYHYQNLYEDARRKLEFFQDKVKQALAVLRPQIDGSNIVAVSVMEELEGLVAMDLNVAQEESRPPQEASGGGPGVPTEPPVVPEAQLF